MRRYARPTYPIDFSRLRQRKVYYLLSPAPLRDGGRMIRLLKVSPYTGDFAAPSPNHDVRKAPAIEGIVLHATADEGEEALSISWLRSRRSRASCHLLVSRAGRVTRLVGDRQRAWHAGVSWWRGTSDVNSITLGIEIANRNDGEPFRDAQYERVADIVAHYCGQGLSLDDVVSHEEVAEGRKTDPLGWDWERFRGMVLQRLWPTDLPAVPGSTPIDRSRVLVSVTPTEKAIEKTTDAKPMLRSRTLWLNACTVIAAGGMLIADALDLLHRVGINPPDEVVKWALFAVGLVNCILRLQTTRPLACGPNGRAPGEPGCPDEQHIVTREVRKQARDDAAHAVPTGRGAIPVG
jgi:hypothetical protein